MPTTLLPPAANHLPPSSNRPPPRYRFNQPHHRFILNPITFRCLPNSTTTVTGRIASPRFRTLQNSAPYSRPFACLNLPEGGASVIPPKILLIAALATVTGYAMVCRWRWEEMKKGDKLDFYMSSVCLMSSAYFFHQGRRSLAEPLFNVATFIVAKDISQLYRIPLGFGIYRILWCFKLAWFVVCCLGMESRFHLLRVMNDVVSYDSTIAWLHWSSKKNGSTPERDIKEEIDKTVEQTRMLKDMFEDLQKRMGNLEKRMGNLEKRMVYSMLQGKRDVDTLLTMGIMEDVSIIPQPAGDSNKIDLTLNIVERKSGGGISAGGGISSGITSGPLAGLIGRKNKKLNVSLERGQIDSIFRINYTDPWIEGDDTRTSRSIMIQNSRTPGTLVHGNQPDSNSFTIGRVTAGIEYSRPFRPKWNGTLGHIVQRAGAHDDKGNPVIRDFYSSPLTASGNTHDDMLLAKLETVYTGSGDPGSSMFAFNMDQGIPVWPEWLVFNRVNARARKGLVLGCLHLSLSGGHVVGNFPPHEAFAIGGTNSVRGYEEGAVGSGRSCAIGCGEVSFPLTGPVEGVIFADYGTDLGSGSTVPGDPAGARLKPGSGYGYGLGIRVDSPLGRLRLEYAFNDQRIGRFHFGVGLRN